MFNTRAGKCKNGGNSLIGFVDTDPSGRYGRFREILGKGAMKTVYRAFDKVLGREVAWNQVMLNDVFGSPEELRRLYSEVHLLKNLNHDSIMRFYTSWIDTERRSFNFITEMFTSGTLREYRQKYKQVDIRAIKNWARQILGGLVYLHSHDPPVIHRDLKCDNIFVNGHIGQVKIGDLGLATILRGSHHAHSVIGTPEFMAPELYEEEYDELVDVYSFGMSVLEMLTSEYPYSECSNPAQIYKKVTSGKKPDSFYRIENIEAQQFVGKCLETASNRPPARELLLDPFLASDVEPLPISRLPIESYAAAGGALGSQGALDERIRSTEMTITGKMNPEDNTIYLKVKISDEDGNVRNVHFPFDILNDVAIDVAMEMVKELDINEWEPFEIAEMINEEISALLPGLNHWGSPQSLFHDSFHCDDDDNQPPYDCLSPESSSHDYLAGLTNSAEFQSRHGYPGNIRVPEDLPVNDDASSQSSHGSYNYSSTSFFSCKDDSSSSNPERAETLAASTKTHGCTRFCPEGDMKGKGHEQYNNMVLLDPAKDRASTHSTKMSRIRSFLDVRSQLLHRSLMQTLHKRRLFKTVGAVENIGFQVPGELSEEVKTRIRGS